MHRKQKIIGNDSGRENMISTQATEALPVSYNAVISLASQLFLDTNLFFQEILWVLGEERINRVMPTYEQFREWSLYPDGLYKFWEFANKKLGTELNPDEIHDIWSCIDLTLNARKRRRGLTFQDFLMVAIRSEQICQYCRKKPPEVTLEIDHILPVSKGGTNDIFNLRFLCLQCNRSRGNRFRWSDIWRNL